MDEPRDRQIHALVLTKDINCLIRVRHTTYKQTTIIYPHHLNLELSNSDLWLMIRLSNNENRHQSCKKLPFSSPSMARFQRTIKKLAAISRDRLPQLCRVRHWGRQASGGHTEKTLPTRHFRNLHPTWVTVQKSVLAQRWVRFMGVARIKCRGCKKTWFEKLPHFLPNFLYIT